MALNKYMHPRNPYRSFPNFKQLAIDYPSIRKYLTQDLKGKVAFDFKEENAVRALTTILLHRDFSLSVEIPTDRLVPTLPLRLNYILWIEDILTSMKITETPRGIDIGTGASCIYPLLAAKRNDWIMLGTEIDDESVKTAQDNVEKNHLENLIKVVEVKEDQFLDGVIDGQFDFTMCNPPFFAEASELKSNKGRNGEERPNPRNAPTGTPKELVAPGGEVAFIKKIIEDSVKLNNQIRVYTVMLGHKVSVGEIKRELQKAGVSSITGTEFCQGRTTRWGIAWSFVEDLSKVPKLGGIPNTQKEKPPIKFSFPKPQMNMPFDFVKQTLLLLMEELKIIVEAQTDEDEAFGITIRALEKTWMNQSRKKRRQEKFKMELSKEQDPEPQPQAIVSEIPGVQSVANDKERTENLLNMEKDNGTSKTQEIQGEMLEYPESGVNPNKRTFSDSEENETCVLLATIIIYDCDEEILLELTYVEGTGGRESANQVCQFLKNRFMKL